MWLLWHNAMEAEGAMWWSGMGWGGVGQGCSLVCGIVRCGG